MNKKSKALSGVQIGVAEHDAARITALFQEGRESIERYLRSRLRGSTEEAKELAQDAYLRLINRRKRREVHNWEKLLWCTARNLANNRVKQRSIRRAANVLMQIETKDYRTPETSCTDEQTHAAVQRAIGALPQRSQDVIARLKNGQNYEQIAQELGVNERTCRRDVELAILEIRQVIGLGRHT